MTGILTPVSISAASMIAGRLCAQIVSSCPVAHLASHFQT
jgi:hypothetical protein